MEVKGSVLACSAFTVYLLFGLPSGIWDWTCLALIWASVCLLCTFVQLPWRKNHYNRLVNVSSCRGLLCRKFKGVCPSSPASSCSVPCCSCALGAHCCLKTRLRCSWGYLASLPKAPRLRPLHSCLPSLLLKNTWHSCTECRQVLLNNMAPLIGSLLELSEISQAAWFPWRWMFAQFL